MDHTTNPLENLASAAPLTTDKSTIFLTIFLRIAKFPANRLSNTHTPSQNTAMFTLGEGPSRCLVSWGLMSCGISVIKCAGASKCNLFDTSGQA